MLQAYTTPTVCDIYAFAILFESSVSQPFFASCVFLNTPRAHYAVLLGGIISRVEPFGKLFRNHRSTWFPLLSVSCIAEFDTPVICHVLILCLGSFLLQDKF